MTPKIQEFAEQCEGMTICECGSTGFDYEKFAQSIIQECIDYCGDNLSKTVSHALKIHFGVDQ